MVSEDTVDVTGDQYRQTRGHVRRWDDQQLARRATTLLHRRAVYGLRDTEKIELQAIVDEDRVRGRGLLT